MQLPSVNDKLAKVIVERPASVLGEVRDLLDEGADPNTRINLRKNLTVLHQAVYYGMDGVIGALLEAGADPNIVTGDSMTALDFCTPKKRKGPKYRPKFMERHELLKAAGAKSSKDLTGLHRSVA